MGEKALNFKTQIITTSSHVKLQREAAFLPLQLSMRDVFGIDCISVCGECVRVCELLKHVLVCFCALAFS